MIASLRGVLSEKGVSTCIVEAAGVGYLVQVSSHTLAALPERLHIIVDRIAAVMDEHAPDCVAVEEAFYHDSVRSTLVLGHVRGALIYAAMRHGVDVAEYSPREVKMSVAGGGGAAKAQVEFMVRRLLGLSGTLQADAADALAVAICHLNRSGRSAPARAARVAARGLEALLARRRAR